MKKVVQSKFNDDDKSSTDEENPKIPKNSDDDTSESEPDKNN